MMQLQDRFPHQDISYIAAVHTNTDNRHVHILALIKVKRIPKKDLSLLIRTATMEARRQRRQLDRDAGLSPIQLPQHDEPLPRQKPQVAAYGHVFSRNGDLRSFKRDFPAVPPRWIPRCPNCGPGFEMERRGRGYQCPACGLRLNRGYGLGVQLKRGRTLELSLEGVGDP
jgi:hypothetical protein